MKEEGDTIRSRAFLALQLKYVWGAFCMSGGGNAAQLCFPLVDFQRSNSRYENLVMALAENTVPSSPDHQQLTRTFSLPETLRRGCLPCVPF